MRIHRPILAGNMRPFLLFSVITVVLSLLPMLSHAAIFWDDEMEAGKTVFTLSAGAMTYDTSVKFSGSGSFRLNYPSSCQTVTTANHCGGSSGRAIPHTDNLYRRAYFRMSGTGPNPTNSGVFETALAFTKMLHTESTGTSRDWWLMGCCGGKAFLGSFENTPSTGRTTNVNSSITLADNRWYCIETHEQMNTPGVANGIAEAWVDNVKMLIKTDVMFRLAGNTNKWDRVGIFRQIGAGNIWWDRYAAGDSRIGCSGSIPQSDTNPPANPSGISIR